MIDAGDLFEPAESFPNPRVAERYAALVGLDEVKDRLLKEARLLLCPSLLEEWSLRHHGEVVAAVAAFRERIPLFVFAGDIGVGKTELAETFGDALARTEGISVTLLKLSLNARGTGRVGEMTQLISSAFRAVEERSAGQRRAARRSSAVILLIDEADALAQMHHEDRAGVNALIRGISHIAAQQLPVVTILCTNRCSALDPAVERRAAAIFEFKRPNEEQRLAVLERAFAGSGMGPADLRRLAKLTGSGNGRAYGYTYSDLRTRLIPAAVLDAFPERRLQVDRIAELVGEIPASKPFESVRR